jgi:hypothetical protein
VPYQPWLHQPNHSSSSLTAREMEVAILPRQLPRPASHQDVSNEPPPLRTGLSQNNYWSESATTWETPIHREMMGSFETRLVIINSKPQPMLSRTRPTSRRYSREGPRTSLTPPTTKFSQNMLQLTGCDLRFEIVLPKEHQQINQPGAVSPNHSDSSGSAYSQPENSLDKVHIRQAEKIPWSSGNSLSNQVNSDRGVLQPSLYRLSDHLVSTIPSAATLRHRPHPTEAQSPARSLSDINTYAETGQSETITLLDLMAQDQEEHNARMTCGFENDLETQYRKHKLTDADTVNISPKPLALRPKNKTKHLSLVIKPGLLQNARDSLEWGINEVTSITKTKHYNTPVTPIFEEDLPRRAPPLLRPRDKLFGTGNHPLKSPFPFDPPEDVPETGPGENKFTRRLSGAIKQLSGGSPTLPKRTVISNSARRLSGPDTPMPNKTGFMAFLPFVEMIMQRGGVHLQEAVAKAKKKVRFKNSNERKRQRLKKSIVVVGISDQSPGMASMYGH